MLRGWMQRLREEWGNQRQRILLLAAAVLTLNLLSAMAHMALGVWMHSSWYLVLAAYYALLGVMRYGAVRFARKRKECRAEDERFVMRFCGWCLTALTLILAQTITISLAFDRIAVHHEIVMISLATFAFLQADAGDYQCDPQPQSPLAPAADHPEHCLRGRSGLDRVAAAVDDRLLRGHGGACGAAHECADGRSSMPVHAAAGPEYDL